MTTVDQGEVIFELGNEHSGLRVVVGERFDGTLPGRDMVVLTGRVEVFAHPFTGEIETFLFPEDVAWWRQTAEDIRAEGSYKHECDRDVEVELNRENNVVEVAITPHGADPWPLLRYLVFLPRGERDAGAD